MKPPCVVKHGSHTAILFRIGSKHAHLIPMKAGTLYAEKILKQHLKDYIEVETDLHKAILAFMNHNGGIGVIAYDELYKILKDNEWI